MFGKTLRMTTLESRKQLLIAESELNRGQWSGDMAALAAGVGAFTDRAKSIGSIASSAAVLVAGLVALRRAKSVPGDTKPSWLGKPLKGAGLLSTICLALRAKSR